MPYSSLCLELRGSIALITLNRPKKRNAINDALIHDLHRAFDRLGDDTRVVVIHGAGEHFSAGLDLSEHKSRNPIETMEHSQLWHKVFREVQMGRRPVVAALHGAVVGGGLELAASSHVRVADSTTFYALPEGQRGIFVGGGASVRVAQIIGAGRMGEMMLTGRSYNAEEGQALGLSHHLVPEGKALSKALELAERIASNAPLSNYAIIQALPRIAKMSDDEGLFAESLMVALVQSSGEAERRMQEFLDKKAAKAGSR